MTSTSISYTTYCREGFSFVQGLFPREEIQALMHEIHSVFRRYMESAEVPYSNEADGFLSPGSLYRLYAEDRGGYIGCMKAIQNLPRVFALGTSPALLQRVRDLGVQHPAFSTKPIIMFHSPHTAASEGYWRTPAHQDWRSIQGSLNCLVVWLALVDVTDELGPLDVVPASHHRGLLPAEDDEWYMHVQNGQTEDNAYVSVPMRAGDGVLFSAFLLHRSGTNRSEQIRCSLQFRFNDLAEATYLKRRLPDPYMYAPKRELITPDFPKEADLARVFGAG